MDGKTKCRILKGIRQRIADINNIEYEPHPCEIQGCCLGTCQMCDKELEWLTMQLEQKEVAGYRTYRTKDDIENYKFERDIELGYDISNEG